MPSRKPTAEVAFVTRELNSYRLPFFEQVRETLDSEDIHFRVIATGGTGDDRAKGDTAELEWAERRISREFAIGDRDIWYTPLSDVISSADLIITEQATKQLANLHLGFLARRGEIRHGLWGHGRNFQADFEGTRGELVKRWFTRSAHWFFAYTDLSRIALLNDGFPDERISVFNNSTDTQSIANQRAAVDAVSLQRWRESLELGDAPILGYIGGLYPPKRIDFLVRAMDEVVKQLPSARLVVIGGGSEHAKLLEAAESRDWLRSVGPMYGTQRVELAQIFELLLMPGLVGLNIVDGFALGLPTITTSIGWHSPEISYLQDGENGLMTDDNYHVYANAIVDLLEDRPRLAELQRGAERSAASLGIENMTNSFCDGVRSALAAPLR